MAEELQLLSQHQAVGRQVIDDQHRQTATGSLQERCRLSWPVVASDPLQIQVNANRRALARRAAQGDRAAHQLHQLLANAQAQPRPAMLRRCQRADLDKRLEHPRLLFNANPWPTVFDTQVQVFSPGVIALGNHAEADLTTLGELQRVAHQVMHDLPQPQRVEPITPLRRRVECQSKTQAFFTRHRLKQPLDAFEKTLQVSGLRHQLQMACFDLGQVQAIAHQLNQLTCRTMGHL